MAVIKIVPMPGAVGDKGDEGAPGPQGPQGAQGLQGVPGADALWSYNGPWQSNASYAEGDIVTYQGQLYYTKSVTTAGTLPTDTAKFDLIASKGADGEPGLNGLEGETGPQGPAGADGAPGADGADGADALWNYTGEYNGGASYAVGDIATYDGQLWYRKHANGGNVGDTPSEGFIWDLLAAKGESGTPLNFWNYVGERGLPTEDGLLVVDGISGREAPGEGNVAIFAGPSASVILAGNNGEFLKDSNVPENQIATIGDIKETALNYSNSPVPPTHHGSVGDLKNDIRYDATHLYICVEDYTDGTTIIWKRINWASGNW